MVRICLDPGVVSQVSLRSKKQRLNPYLWVISCAVVNIIQEFFRAFFLFFLDSRSDFKGATVKKLEGELRTKSVQT